MVSRAISIMRKLGKWGHAGGLEVEDGQRLVVQLTEFLKAFQSLPGGLRQGFYQWLLQDQRRRPIPGYVLWRRKNYWEKSRNG